ncbi:MAG: hypothetical protein WDO13_01725 [Verrucomicrobiota bacterium]
MSDIKRQLLHRGWTFRQLGVKGRAEWHAARVPGCVHTDLRRNGLIPDPFWGSNELGLQWIEEADWAYRCAFTPSAALLAREHVELVAEGLDTLATIKLNGREIGRSESMFFGLRIDVKPLLKPKENVPQDRLQQPVGLCPGAAAAR